MRSASLIMALSAALIFLTAGCLEGETDSITVIEEEGQLELHSEKIPLNEGNTGEAQIPLVGVNFVDTDVKHHWGMPSNISGIMVNVSWEGSGWGIELAIGTGDCPHSGRTFNTTHGTSGDLSVRYRVEGNESLEMTQWFCHLAMDDPSSHRGETFSYVFDVTLFSYQEIDCEGGVCPV